MKRIFIFLITLLAGINSSIQAYYFDPFRYENSCCDNVDVFYIEALAGPNFLQTTSNHDLKIDYSPGYILATSLGFHWFYGIRFEGEYAYRRNEANKANLLGNSHSAKGQFQSSSFMANILWDFPLSFFGCHITNFQPFIGAGIGYDAQKIHIRNNKSTWTKENENFAWQVMTGLNYSILDNADISLEYKLHKGGFKTSYSHSLGIGFTYKFDLGIWRQQH